jgi:plastocyanin
MWLVRGALKTAAGLLLVLGLVFFGGACSDNGNRGKASASPASRPENTAVATNTAAAATVAPTTAPVSTPAPAVQATNPPPVPTSPPPAPTNPPAPTSPPGPASQSIVIADFSYAPNAFSVRVGQTVTVMVQNSGSFPHTFTISGVVASGTLGGGASTSVSFTPTQAGTLTFFCSIHGQATMSGTVTVAN